MARLFKGKPGTSAYNAAAGKFDEVDSTYDPVTKKFMVPFKYADEADFLKRVDLSLAGNMMDCGECHVGGGAMEFLPNKDLAARIPLRAISTTNIPGFGDADESGTGAPITAADYTAFNYFIDNYDVDEDGNENEAQYMDYTKTGVMEMDCLLCHLPGYKYEERRAAVRDAKIDATRAIGAGFATANAMTWPDGGQPAAGYGTTVVYDESQFTIGAGDELILSGGWMDENVAAKPDSNNCANCHMNEFSVDWKKRGDHWAPEGQYDFQYEVHYSMGCLGCHERKPTAAQPGPYTSVGAPENFPAMGAGLLGHDPAKGDSPYSGLYNGNDKAAFKSCENCHLEGADDGESYAAPNPNAAHAAAGLTAKVVQAASSIAGVPSVSHIDIMHCSACHTRNAESYDWGNTGAPMIDATGGDHEKRLTDHENPYVIRQDMTDQTSLAWTKGKLLRINPSATMFWRDKNDTTEMDANQDGRPHGMDALLMTQVLATNNANNWGSITEDNHGVVTPSLFAERIGKLKSDIEAWTGQANAKIKFSIFHVNFQEQHGVSPAAMAYGANGCTDCHDAGATFYNGSIDTTGTANTMVYGAGTSQRVPFTKVNGFSQPTDWHPGQKDKLGKRSIAVQISNVPYDFDGDTVNDSLTTRPIERSENMYESTFMGAADFAESYTSSAAIDFSGFEKGWQLIVEVKDVANGTITKRLKMVGGDMADVTDLLSGLGATFTDGTFGFKVVGADIDNADLDDDVTTGTFEGITVESTDPAVSLIRLKAGNAASFKLIHAAYKNTPWTGVTGATATGRAQWVAYLDTLTDPAAVGIGVDPVAAISSVPASVELGSTVQMLADTGVNTQGTFSYSWTCADTAGEVLEGETVDKTFDKVGPWLVTLKVLDEEGKLAQVSQEVNVVAPAPDTVISATDNGPGAPSTLSITNMPAHTRLYILWGDGGRQWVTDAQGDNSNLDVEHTFQTYSKYDKGDHYEFKVYVMVYDGSSRVETEVDTISIYK